MVYFARIRGIYATALAALLLKHGFLLSDLSKVLRSRIDVPVSDRPPHITVKTSDESLDELLIIAYPWEAGVEAEKAILSEVEDAAVVRGKLGLHSVVDVVSKGSCLAEAPSGILVEVQQGGVCPGEGEVLRATVVKDSLREGERIVVKPGVELVGLTVRVSVPGSGVSFSKFVRDEFRPSLISALEGRVDLSRAHVRFRSGASLASPLEVAEEARRLFERAVKLAEEKPSGQPALVERGEYISIIVLPKTAKRVMDKLRGSLYPTVNRHHEVKSWGGDIESTLVDFAEEGLKRGLWGPEAGDLVVEFIAGRLAEAKKVYIRHVTPRRKVISIGPFHVASIARGQEPGELNITLERTFKSYGTYDALGVEKRPGDRGVTRIDTSKWYVIHEYYSASGELLGVYANINTPPEVGSSGIKYLDLYIDVVKRPGSEPEIVDAEQLEKAYHEGLITDQLYKRAKAEAERVVNVLKSNYH